MRADDGLETTRCHGNQESRFDLSSPVRANAFSTLREALAGQILSEVDDLICQAETLKAVVPKVDCSSLESTKITRSTEA